MQPQIQLAMRLQQGGAYVSDLNALRNQIRANGTVPALAVVSVTHPSAPGVSANLHLNMAYQANSNLPAINGSLYSVAFSNPNGTWHFNVGMIGVALPGILFPGALVGSYASLGYALALPPITDAALLGAVQAVHHYAGTAPVPPGVLTAMAVLIIAVNEATRFSIVQNGVGGVLGNTSTYAPPVATIHNWGGHSLGS